jgi:hypothetical protein
MLQAHLLLRFEGAAAHIIAEEELHDLLLAPCNSTATFAQPRIPDSAPHLSMIRLEAVLLSLDGSTVADSDHVRVIVDRTQQVSSVDSIDTVSINSEVDVSVIWKEGACSS